MLFTAVFRKYVDEVNERVEELSVTHRKLIRLGSDLSKAALSDAKAIPDVRNRDMTLKLVISQFCITLNLPSAP